jgi:hypothetical protein
VYNSTVGSLGGVGTLQRIEALKRYLEWSPFVPERCDPSWGRGSITTEPKIHASVRAQISDLERQLVRPVPESEQRRNEAVIRSFGVEPVDQVVLSLWRERPRLAAIGADCKMYVFDSDGPSVVVEPAWAGTYCHGLEVQSVDVDSDGDYDLVVLSVGRAGYVGNFYPYCLVSVFGNVGSNRFAVFGRTPGASSGDSVSCAQSPTEAARRSELIR